MSLQKGGKVDVNSANDVMRTALSMALDVHSEHITEFVVVARAICQDCGDGHDTHFLVSASNPGQAVLMFTAGINEVVGDTIERHGQ